MFLVFLSFSEFGLAWGLFNLEAQVRIYAKFAKNACVLTHSTLSQNLKLRLQMVDLQIWEA